MAAEYSQGKLRFNFPADWTLAEEETSEWPRMVSFQIPGGGYWTLCHYPPQSDRLPLMEEVLATFEADYKDLEQEEREEIIGPAFVDGYDLSFFCLDFLVECAVRSYEAPNGTLDWFYQAESEDFEARSPAFRAVSESLLANFV